MSIASSSYFVWLILILKTPRSTPSGLEETMIIALSSLTSLWTHSRRAEKLNTSGDNIQTLRGEIREAELEAQKKRVVDIFYKKVNRAHGLRPDSIDYDQFRIDDDGKTLYWTPGDKKISICTTRGGVRFLALSTLTPRYRVRGTDALRKLL